MIRRILFMLVCTAGCLAVLEARPAQAQQPLGQPAYSQQPYGQQYAGHYTTQDWNRLYHYPYVYYPQNFWGNDYYRSAEDMYYRYPPEMRIPVYNREWHNEYPQPRRYYQGSHFTADTF